VQRNLRNHGARYGLAGQAIDEREHAYVNAALGERGILAEFEVVADVGVGEVESLSGSRRATRPSKSFRQRDRIDLASPVDRRRDVIQDARLRAAGMT
jgi:hypothetical protein